ncbi:unnamed protein product [Rotaria socialis]|uniref:Uncharacterized protein n=1 Tax=Rotaria socialis TaxID=392032 RepID=A0A818TBA5_9BILA|nr:unnamed protein product [Rotaria socialis]
MVRYTIMKRLTKILASIFFIITVVTIYLAFDFAITNALSTKQHSTDKYKTESPLSLMKIKNTNETLKHNSDNQPSHNIIKPDRPVRSLKAKQRLVKPAQFHKRVSTAAPNYYCNTVEFTLSSSDHSASKPTLNCSLQKCNVSSNENTCLSSTTPCFDYRTFNNISYCAPGILCSILEPCNNVTYNCASNTSVCVINSCCSPQAVCLPSASLDFCRSGKNTSLSGCSCITYGTTILFRSYE